MNLSDFITGFLAGYVSGAVITILTIIMYKLYDKSNKE